MSYCYQSTITDKAFKNLRGIHTLDMSWCYQSTISDKAFKNLRGISVLNMTGCIQMSVTVKALDSLEGAAHLDTPWGTGTYNEVSSLCENTSLIC